MLKREYEIIRPFAEKPWRKFTFKEIKLYSRKKSESYVFNILKKFVKLKVLNEQKAGNVVLYSLNIDSEKALIYAGMIAEYLSWDKKHIPHAEIEQLMHKIPTDFFVLIVTGSYASGKQTKNSDLDAVIICDDSFEPKRIYAELKHQTEISIPHIHLYVFRRNEFVKMLADKEANYGKETARNNLVISGGKIYYKIITEAIKNGFIG